MRHRLTLFKIVLAGVVVAGVIGAGVFWRTSHPHWQVISYDGFVGTPQFLPTGVFLFQSEADLARWLAPYGKEVSRSDPQYLYIPDVNFDRETIAYVVAPGAWRVQSVTYHKNTASIALSPGDGRPYTTPPLRLGEAYYRAVILRLPKVTRAQLESAGG